MRRARNAILAALLLVLMFGVGSGKLSANWDSSFSGCITGYFNYGTYLANCGGPYGGYWGGEFEAEWDLQSDCSQFCWEQVMGNGDFVLYSGHWVDDTYYIVDDGICWC